MTIHVLECRDYTDRTKKYWENIVDTFNVQRKLCLYSTGGKKSHLLLALRLAFFFCVDSPSALVRACIALQHGFFYCM